MFGSGDAEIRLSEELKKVGLGAYSTGKGFDIAREIIRNDPSYADKVKKDSNSEMIISANRDKFDKYIHDYIRPVVDKETVEAERKAAEEAEQRERKQREFEKAAAQVMITSGNNFEGYNITKYSGYISGDDAIEIPRGGWNGTDNGQNLTNALVKIRRQSLKELKEAAYSLGCNAVICVDFDYITLEPETASASGGTLYEPYVICVTANGTAVKIEKEMPDELPDI